MTFSDWRFVNDEVGAKRYVVEFPSPIVSGVAPNDTVQLLAFVPNEPKTAVPAVVILHYWGAQDHRVEIGAALELARRGIAGIVISLPYHMERTPLGFRSGDLAITPDPVKLTATMTQSIQDVKRAVDWIQSRSEFRRDRIGIMGSSLGGIVAALVVGVDPRFTHAAFVVGGVDLAGILWHSSRVVKERDILRRRGFTESNLREALIPIEPLTYLKNRRPGASYVVAAKHDTVVPNDASRQLIEALGNPATHWLDTGHYGGFFIQKRVQRSIAEFFEKSFRDEPFVAPSSLNAPTIRLGVTLDLKEGVQIGAGIDLLRPNRRNDPFATVLFNPRGVIAAIGVELDRGLAVGAFLQASGISFGLMWSIVL